MNLNIDKNLSIPIYHQISNQISEAVCKGIVKPGEKMPSERELSAALNISRGSIQKAYELLEKNGIVEIIKGSGCFVLKDKGSIEIDRKQAAVILIDQLLEKLSGLDFTSREIRAFVDIRILERENQYNAVRIAAVDCNPEALEIFRIQFSSMKNTQFKMFILDDILKYSQPDKVLEDYDIIVTTLNHFDQLNGILYSLRDKLYKVAVSPASETIISIATIPENSNIGILTKSIKFRDIIYRNLESFNIKTENIEHALTTDLNGIRKLLQYCSFIIIPHSYSFNNRVFKEGLKEFLKSGGKIIEFKYQIDRGSLIYIDELVSSIRNTR